MIKRQYISLPKYSVITDGGSEFKGLFQDFMYDESIFHKTTVRGRHKQLSLIDNLIGQLSKIFNDYMNMKEIETGKVYKNWTEIIPIVREELNKIREVKLPSNNEFDDRFVNDIREVKKVIYTTTGDKIETIEKFSEQIESLRFYFVVKNKSVKEILDYISSVWVEEFGKQRNVSVSSLEKELMVKFFLEKFPDYESLLYI
jgi:hypothetical protein